MNKYVSLVFNIISVLFAFISYHVYVINFILISLKTFYSVNPFMSLKGTVQGSN